MKKIPAILQFFHGFYETIWSPDLSNYEYEEEVEYDDYEFDNAQYEHDVCSTVTSIYNDWLQDLFGNHVRVEFERVKSPREYNHAKDEAYTYITYDECGERMIRAKFEEYYWNIKALVTYNHTSYPGFCSFMENDARLWTDEMLFEDVRDSELYLACLLDYIIMSDFRSRGWSMNLNEIAYECCEVYPESYCTITSETILERNRQRKLWEASPVLKLDGVTLYD